jgi:putative transposase
MSYRDVEELLGERGLEVSYETVRRWVLKFGPAFARNLRRLRPRPSTQWHLDEMAVVIGGKRLWLWRAVDSEGEVLKSSCSPAAHTQAAEEARACSTRARHGSAPVLRLCPTAAWDASPP